MEPHKRLHASPLSQLGNTQNYRHLGMSGNGVYPQLKPFSRDNDQQNHWVFRGTLFSDKPILEGVQHHHGPSRPSSYQFHQFLTVASWVVRSPLVPRWNMSGSCSCLIFWFTYHVCRPILLFFFWILDYPINIYIYRYTHTYIYIYTYYI